LLVCLRGSREGGGYDQGRSEGVSEEAAEPIDLLRPLECNATVSLISEVARIVRNR
jgi:hypothetical protein